VSFLSNITPADLGFTKPFVNYEPIQSEAIDWIAEQFSNGVGFVGAALPTGSGKSLLAVSIAKALSLRACFVTAFKGLEEQYLADYKNIGLVDIRGRSNYDCAGYGNLDCRGGASVGCQFTRGKGCTYEVEKAIAKDASLVTTNYSYWFTVNDKAQGIQYAGKEAEEEGENPFELLVLDEGDEAVKLLADYVSCRVYESDAKKYKGYPRNESLIEWSAWALGNLPVIDQEIKDATAETIAKGRKVTTQHTDKLHKLQSLAQTMTRIAYATGDDWIVEMSKSDRYGYVWHFDCIRPGRFARRYLFCDVPNVLIMAATLKERTFWDLNVGRTDYSYRSWRRIFPANRHPIYRVHAKRANGKSISLKYDAPDKDIAAIIEFMDREIIKPRLDRKGLIATMAYRWQSELFKYSKYANIMIGNTKDPGSDSAQQVAEEFRLSEPPTILASPSFSSGWDFAFDQCEYIVVLKTPIIPAQSKVVKARLKLDQFYTASMGMQMLEQIVGRGMRRVNDRCEVFLIDGSMAWWLYQYQHLAQDWFPAAVRGIPSVPKPPMRLVDELGLSKGKLIGVSSKK
jgi:Rad3-related DNA helicase